MLVVASRKLDKKKRIYHRCGCIYARRIKLDNCIEMSSEQIDVMLCEEWMISSWRWSDLKQS